MEGHRIQIPIKSRACLKNALGVSSITPANFRLHPLNLPKTATEDSIHSLCGLVAARSLYFEKSIINK